MNNGSLCPTFVLKHASVSDMGMRRTNNQDSLAVIVTDDVATWATRGHLLMVADGMGAHAAGELASKMAVDNIPHTYFKLRDLYPPAALRQAIRDANAVIHTKGQSSIGFQGMGTTCSCLVLLPQGALVAHIGDSRVYRLRGNVLEQLTFDHSLVWEMAAAGQMTEEEVPAYIPKNVITRSLGPHPTVHIDLEGPYNAARRRHVSALQRRPERAGHRRRDWRDPAMPAARGGGRNARRSGQPPRRAGQHFGDRRPRRRQGMPLVDAPTPTMACRPPRMRDRSFGLRGRLLIWLAAECAWAYWSIAWSIKFGMASSLPAVGIAGDCHRGHRRLARGSSSALPAHSLRSADPTATVPTARRKASQPQGGRRSGRHRDRTPRDAGAETMNPPIDWQPFDDRPPQAAAAADRGDNAAAIRQYATPSATSCGNFASIGPPSSDTRSFDNPIS